MRIGFIGGGMMSQVGHIPFYVENPACTVVAIAESRPSLRDPLNALCGRDVVVSSHKDLLARDDIDAIVLSAPRPAVGPLSLAVLEAGKHLLTEKPMAHTAAQAARLVEEASHRKLTYAVGYMKQFDPGVETCKAALDRLRETGEIGDLLHARIFDYSKNYAHPVPPHTRPQESRVDRFETWSLEPDWVDPSLAELYRWFLNAGCHDVNLLGLFFGRDVSVQTAMLDPAGMVTASIQAGDARVQFEVAKCAAGRWMEGAEFIFERGCLSLSIPSPMDQNAVGQVTLMRDDATAEDLTPQAQGVSTWSFARQARGFVEALCGRSSVRCSGADGLQDMTLTEEIWRRGE